MGQLVEDPVRGLSGTVTGRAVYLNGCSRVLIEPRQTVGQEEIDSWWVDEKQVEPKNSFLGKKKIVKEPERKTSSTSSFYTGGPAPKSSKY